MFRLMRVAVREVSVLALADLHREVSCCIAFFSFLGWEAVGLSIHDHKNQTEAAVNRKRLFLLPVRTAVQLDRNQPC